MFAVQGFRGTEIHGHAMLNHPIALSGSGPKPPADVRRPPSPEMISNQLTTGLVLEDVLVMRDAQANAYTQVRVSVKTGSPACEVIRLL